MDEAEDISDSCVSTEHLVPDTSNRSHRRVRTSQVVSPVISEDDESITIRQPVTCPAVTRHGQTTGLINSPVLSRYRYYGRLAPYHQSTLVMPNHVVPAEYYLVIPLRIEAAKQSSLVTIFSIWNTMMGTSILSMPWALERAGFGCGLILMVSMAGLMLYTAYRIMTSPHSAADLEGSENVDFSAVCRHYLGHWAEILSVIFSLFALLGGAVVYWVLMSNFLFHTVTFIHDKVTEGGNRTDMAGIDNYTFDGLFVIGIDFLHKDNGRVVAKNNHSVFGRVWNQYLSVPLFLVAVLFPLVNFKSPTFFTKLNSLGMLSVAYILVFVSVKAGIWGFHMNFSSTNTADGVPGQPKETLPHNDSGVALAVLASMTVTNREFQWTFPALTGILSLGYFIHNAVISIVRNQRNPENNGRDLTIAFICVAFTYIFVAVIFYSCFPLQKNCIEDMTTVFPLLLFIFRIQVFCALFGNIYPGLKHVVILNCCVIAVCVLMAIFLPKIGTIIRFSGALCGLVYTFMLPCVVYMMIRRQQATLTVPIVCVHVVIVIIGVLNFVAQFLIL